MTYLDDDDTIGKKKRQGNNTDMKCGTHEGTTVTYLDTAGCLRFNLNDGYEGLWDYRLKVPLHNSRFTGIGNRRLDILSR
jgi:hypothetical protein